MIKRAYANAAHALNRPRLGPAYLLDGILTHVATGLRKGREDDQYGQNSAHTAIASAVRFGIAVVPFRPLCELQGMLTVNA